MFEKLANQKNIGAVPEYLQEMLKICGFNTPGSFAMLKESDYERLFTSINNKVRSYATRPIENKVRKIIEMDLELLDQAMDNFEIPFGHENIIKAIKNYYSASKESRKPFRELPKAKHHKTDQSTHDKFLDLAEREVPKCINLQLVDDLKEITVKNEDEKWFISCPVCEKDIGVCLHNKHGSCIITNYRDHLKKHGMLPNVIPNSDDVIIEPMELSTSSSQASTSSSSTSSSSSIPLLRANRIQNPRPSRTQTARNHAGKRARGSENVSLECFKVHKMIFFLV